MKHTHTFKQVWCLRMCVCGGVREGGEKVGNTRSCHVVTTALFFVRVCFSVRQYSEDVDMASLTYVKKSVSEAE